MRSKSKSALGALIVVLALSGLTAGSALASGPPIVETNPATAIGGSEATLNGTVEPNQASTKYYFEYGTTTSYGSKTAEATVIAHAVSKTIERLATSTTYHFRIVATNSLGTSNGADQMFTTTATAKPEFAVKAGEKLTDHQYTGGFGLAYWENANQQAFACSDEGSSFTGRVLGAKTVSGKISFTRCGFGGRECKSEGAKEGEIATVELEGTLVYISKATKTVGLDFKPKSGEVLTSFKGCYQGQVTGSIIIPISPVNKLTQTFGTGTLRETRGIQEIAQYESESGKIGHGSLSTTWPSGFNGALGWSVPGFTVATNKEIEIKA